jgi:L-iditol 2-dehydrogenase
VHNTSTCGTDLKIFKHGHHHIDPPRVIGHEVAGEVVETGANVPGWNPGDRVQVIAAIPCGECRQCRRGLQQVCPHQQACDSNLVHYRELTIYQADPGGWGG